MQLSLSVPANGVLMIDIDNFAYHSVVSLQDMLTYPIVINYNPLTHEASVANQPAPKVKEQLELTGLITIPAASSSK